MGEGKAAREKRFGGFSSSKGCWKWTPESLVRGGGRREKNCLGLSAAARRVPCCLVIFLRFRSEILLKAIVQRY
ncbi:hypothetical protein H6P81_004562 [Aristolochia fimbriata]|uniref:Uncharacterized protein n=1 Tax=Aristolochia fimbriata TaxID=158543 RepID=A0AAV7FH61_ARIFI|nr:hypothetical protein H6P81_004562 [Aristolochia fimbriata]